MEKVQQLKNEDRRITFPSDGVNDAPVLALTEAGIVMAVCKVMQRLKLQI